MYGGIAQGIGGALYERMAYDDQGQLLNASFMDFLMPYATEVPGARAAAHRDTVAQQRARDQGRRRGGRRSRSPRRSPTRSRTRSACRSTRCRSRRQTCSSSCTRDPHRHRHRRDVHRRRGDRSGRSMRSRPRCRRRRATRRSPSCARSRRRALATSPRSCTARPSPPTPCSRTTSSGLGFITTRGLPRPARDRAPERARQATATRTSGSSRTASCRCISCRRSTSGSTVTGTVLRAFDEAGARAVARWFREQRDRLRRRLLPALVRRTPTTSGACATVLARGAPRLHRVAQLRRAARVPRVRALGDDARRRVRQAARRPPTWPDRRARARSARPRRSTS